MLDFSFSSTSLNAVDPIILCRFLSRLCACAQLSHITKDNSREVRTYKVTHETLLNAISIGWCLEDYNAFIQELATIAQIGVEALKCDKVLTLFQTLYDDFQSAKATQTPSPFIEPLFAFPSTISQHNFTKIPIFKNGRGAQHKWGWWNRKQEIMKGGQNLKAAQVIALSKIFCDPGMKAPRIQTDNEIHQSGCVVLPCGSGKTLIIALTAAMTKGNSLIICKDLTGVNQLVETFRKWTNLRYTKDSYDDTSDFVILTSETKVGVLNLLRHKGENKDATAIIVITTYSMLHNRQKGKFHDPIFDKMSWKFLGLDEAHTAAVHTRTALSNIGGRVDKLLAFTATEVRSDDQRVSFIAGPKLFELMRVDAVQMGLALDGCIHIVRYNLDHWGEAGAEIKKAYLENSDKSGTCESDDEMEGSAETEKNDPAKIAKNTKIMGRTNAGHYLEFANPINLLLLRFLVHFHAYKQKQKVIIFVRRINMVMMLVNWFRWTFMSGSSRSEDEASVQGIDADMTDEEREYIKWHFNNGNINVLITTTVGETGMDVPNAQIAIELTPNRSTVSLVQKMGRICRKSEVDAYNQCWKNGPKFIFYLLTPDIKESNERVVTRHVEVLHKWRDTIQTEGYDVYESTFRNVVDGKKDKKSMVFKICGRDQHDGKQKINCKMNCVSFQDMQSTRQQFLQDSFGQESLKAMEMESIHETITIHRRDYSLHEMIESQHGTRTFLSYLKTLA